MRKEPRMSTDNGFTDTTKFAKDLSFMSDKDWARLHRANRMRMLDRHSVNCYFCGSLADERECIPADEFNGGDGGDACPKCAKERQTN